VFIWYIFCLFWYHIPRKIWQPWSTSKINENPNQGDQMSLLIIGPKSSPTHFVKINTYITFFMETFAQKMCFWWKLQKNTRRKDSTNRRKFAQSGHKDPNRISTQLLRNTWGKFEAFHTNGFDWAELKTGTTVTCLPTTRPPTTHTPTTGPIPTCPLTTHPPTARPLVRLG
jgi:hypothetical protein